MTKTYQTTPDNKLTIYPPGIPYIIGNEGCERFSFYGMKAILYVYLWNFYINHGIFTDTNLAQNEATAVVHLFNAGVYALPMIGAIIADRLFGKYNIILWLSMVYCLGHAFLAIFETNLTGFYAGLLLIAIGSGGIKPCVSAHVGDQFGEANKNKISTVYKMFYFIINFGSFFSSLLIPFVLEKSGPALAFGIPGILMAIATLFFWMGRNKFIHVPAKPGGKLGFLDALSGTLLFLTVGSLFFTAHQPTHIKIIVAIISFIAGLIVFLYRQKIEEDDGFLATNILKLTNPSKIKPEQAEATNAVWKIISIFFMVSVFWALFDQHSSTWIRQAEMMKLNVSILGYELNLLASQIPASNPILVMILIPITSLLLYPAVDKFLFKFTPLRIMTCGMLMAALSFLAVYFLQIYIDQQEPNSVSVIWQMIPYTIITLAEVMVSITGLEFAYTQAPKRMKSTIMGFWLLTVALGNVLTAMLARFGDLSLSNFFLVFAGLMAVAGFIFGLRAKFYQVKTY